MHGGGGSGTATAQHAGRLAWALALTATYMVAEVAGGLITGSLALLADAAHMLTDVAGLALALLAIRFAAREATPQRTYGYLRMEVLAALTNAVVLLLLTVYILYEAYRRFMSPPEVMSGPMLAVAAIGLAVNLVSMRLLAGGSSESLNVKGAYFEVLSDMLGSIGVILAALLMMWKGWRLADPLIGAGIGLFIVPRTFGLLRQVVHILMEGTPPTVDLAILERELMEIANVISVHDLHVWTITSGFDAMSCHLVVTDFSVAQTVLAQARRMMGDEFGIDHVTIQVDDDTLSREEKTLHV
ncbi:MAG: cation transporter [Hyphomicrobiales bacterium]|nr:cation transporter [Hyphomicrobiales bacterium]